MSEEAEDIIALRDRERSKIANYWSLCQDCADLMFPRDNQITTTSAPGTLQTEGIHDVTAIKESENMSSGLSAQLVPPGQEFFAIRASNRELNDIQEVRDYLDTITEKTHEELFVSNFLMELNETLRSLIVFGTGNLYSEFAPGMGLNFTDYDVGSYQMLQNAKKRPDTMILTLPLSAKQAVQEFGEENVGKATREMNAKPKRRNDTVDFIHIVRPREKRNPELSDVGNLPFESLYVDVKDKIVVEGINPNGQPNRTGFPEFPYHPPRWTRRSNEVHGRGIGTELLPHVRQVNRMKADFIELGGRWARSPLEVLESFDGEVDMTPDATNWVTERETIKGIEGGAKGDYIITKDILEMERDVIREAFFKNVFEQLGSLTGDRRTTIEIIERLKEGLKKLSSPIGRVIAELFTPLITRVVLLLIRNGVLPPPPAVLQGQSFRVDYIGPLALALRDQHVRAFEYWVGIIGAMDETFPAAKDNVEYDKAIRDMGEFVGVKNAHIRPIRDRDIIRQQRQQLQERQHQMEMAQLMGQAYSQTTKAPEPGSGAEQLQEALSG
jgi:hypothetical protein